MRYKNFVRKNYFKYTKFINRFKGIEPKEVFIYKFYIRLYAEYFGFKFKGIIAFILKIRLRKFFKIRNNPITFKMDLENFSIFKSDRKIILMKKKAYFKSFNFRFNRKTLKIVFKID